MAVGEPWGHAEWRAGPCPIQTPGLGTLMYTVSGLREVISDVAPTRVIIGSCKYYHRHCFSGGETDEPVKYPNNKENMCWHGKAIIS